MKQRRWTFIRCGIACALLVLASCGREHLRSTVECRRDHQCPEAERCEQGTCAAPSASTPASENTDPAAPPSESPPPESPPTEPPASDPPPVEPPPTGPAAITVSSTHAELRSVLSGHPGCGGKQLHASNMVNVTIRNVSAVPAPLTLRLRDARQRFLWTDCVLQAERGQMSGVLAPGGQWQGLGVTWNSGEDSGIAHSNETGVEIHLEGQLHTFVTVHGKSRQPVTCPSTRVSWSASSAASGPCAAAAPSMLESLADPGPGFVLADPALSDPGYSGRQGVSCAAVTFTSDTCGAQIPTSGGPVYTYPAYFGEEACAR